MGLHDDWSRIIATLERIIPVYGCVNHFISLGQDVSYRREAIKGNIHSEDLVLDAGCGPGIMSQIALHFTVAEDRFILLDASRHMLTYAKKRLETIRSSAVTGLFESLPFKEKVFDVVMFGFSIRDAQDIGRAVSEIIRVLKDDGGRLIITDLGKPNNRLCRWIIGVYWRWFAVFLACLAVGRMGLNYSAIHATYQKLLRNSQFKKLLENSFSKVSFKTKMLGGVVIVYAERF